MKKTLAPICILTLCLAVPSIAHRHRIAKHVAVAPDQNGCALQFAGSARKAVKLRATNLSYPLHNGGSPISVSDFLQFVCPLDAQVQLPVPAATAMSMEKVTLTIRAFVVAMKLDPDNDLHIQIADKASPYDQAQIIVEIPPGATYCGARSHMMDLYRADGGGAHLTKHVFNNPPQVDVSGYLFLDSAHGTASCTANGGRGIRNGLDHSPVQGIWEIHPVIKLEKVS